MKQLKCLPFLIAAAAYVPRAHAATEATQSVEPSSISLLLICAGLIVLSCARRSGTIKVKD